MRICIFGSEEDKNAISDSMLQTAKHSFNELQAERYSDYEDFVCNGSNGANTKYDIVFVTADNAAGMECVIAAKKVFSKTPVIWLSNDNDFAAESYRLGTDYFHAKPITASVIEKAIQKSLIPNQI